MDTNGSPSSASLKSTVPLYHFEGVTTPQTGDWAKDKNNEIKYYNGMPMYPRGYSFQEFQQRIPAWPTESRDLVPNNQKARNCNCCCHGQNIPSRQYPAVDLKNPRPSVIMVPVGWSSNDPGMSHLPLEVTKCGISLRQRDVSTQYYDSEVTSHWKLIQKCLKLRCNFLANIVTGCKNWIEWGQSFLPIHKFFQ